MTKYGIGLIEGIKCIIYGTEERTQHDEEVRAVLCYLVTATRRPTFFKTMMAKPRLQSLGHDAPPSPPPPAPASPGRLEMPTVDGAGAAFARRFASLHLVFMCETKTEDKTLKKEHFC